MPGSTVPLTLLFRGPSNPLPRGVHKDVHTALHKFLLVTSQPDTHVWQTAAFFKTQQRPQSSFPMPVHESRKSLRHLPSSAPLSFLCRKKLGGYDEKEKLSFKVAQPQLRRTSLVCGSPSHPIQSQSLRPLKENGTRSPVSRHAKGGRPHQCSPCENERVGQLMPGARPTECNSE